MRFGAKFYREITLSCKWLIGKALDGGGENGSRFTGCRQVAQRRHLASKRRARSELAVCQLLRMFADGSGVLPDLRVVRHSSASLTLQRYDGAEHENVVERPRVVDAHDARVQS